MELFLEPLPLKIFAPPLRIQRRNSRIQFYNRFSVDKRIAAVKSVTQLCIALIVHALYLKKVHEKFILGDFILRLEKNRQLDSSKITLKKVKLPKDQISRTIKCF